VATKIHLVIKPSGECLHIGGNNSWKAKRWIVLFELHQALSHGVVMPSPLRTPPVALDVLVEPPVQHELAKLSALNDESSVAVEQISRGRTLRWLIVANLFAWLVIVMIVRLIFF
jgi:hypothetical protein